MFESVLIESSAGGSAWGSIWTKTVSLTVEVLLLGLAILAPLLYTEALPKHLLIDTINVPAPPPPASLPRAQSAASQSLLRSELNDGQILMPRMIPRRVKEIQDEAEGPAISSGAVEGVPFGVPGSTGDPTIANLLHNLPTAGPKSVTPRSVRVSSGVAQGLLIHEVRPPYPALARSARIQGPVVLQATIGKDGTIRDLHLLSGHPLLAQAALEAARQWRYRPYLLNDEPVEVDTTITVNFTLGSAQ